jgi:hypothetical protein
MTYVKNIRVPLDLVCVYTHGIKFSIRNPCKAFTLLAEGVGF